MKSILNALLLTGSLVAASAASAATYQLCNTSGCRTGGSAFAWTSYAKTKYPIVLAHGIMGFTNVASVEYFYGVAPDLTSNGANVFDTQVSSLDSSYVRGEQLRSQVQTIMAITGAPKVNLIGHSQGAMDARYVAGVIPANIASVTSVGGVNFGTPVADAVSQFVGIPVVGTAVGAASAAVADAFFALIDVASGHYYDQNSLAAMTQLTTASAAIFNAQFPAGLPTTACGNGVQKASNGVSYFSWGGTSPLTNVIDPLDYLFTPTSFIIPSASDGMVPQCSQHLGTNIRDNYAMNHGDEVNQVLGLVSVFEVSPVTIYRDQANRLKNIGL